MYLCAHHNIKHSITLISGVINILYVCFLQTLANAGTAQADICSHNPHYKPNLHVSYTCLHPTSGHYSGGSDLIAEAKCAMEILSLINIPIIF